MDEIGCDCRTVGECIIKYNIPNDWCAEFDVCGGIYPIICMQAAQIRRTPAVMDLKLRVAAKDEYAGCMVDTDRKTVAFKVDCISDLTKAIKAE